MVNKFKPRQPDPLLGKIKGDSELARLAHLNKMVDDVNTEISNINVSQNAPILTLKGTTTIPNGRLWADGAVFRNVAVVRSQLTNNLYAYDIKNPNNPVLAKDFGTAYQQGFYFDGYLLIAYQATPNPDLVEFYDMSNPYVPVLLGSLAQNVGLVYEIIKKGNLVFMMDSSDNIYTFDVTDYANVKYIGQQFSGGNVYQERGIDVGDNYLLTWGQDSANRSTGTSVLFKVNWNLGTLTLLERADKTRTFIALGVKAYGDKFVIAGQEMTTSEYGFRVCGIQNNQVVYLSPFVKSKYTFTNYNTEDNWGTQMKLLNDYLFLSSKEGHILLYNIKDPLNISLVQDFDLSSVMLDIRALPGDSNFMFVGSKADNTKVSVLQLNDYSVGVINAGEISSEDFYSQNGFVSSLNSYSLMSNRAGFQNAKIINFNAQKQFLPPKYTTTERTALTPTEGEVVYDITLHKLYVYDGTAWQAAW